MGEWQFSGHEFPEAKSETEDVGLPGVLRALGEHLGGHPTEIALRKVEKICPCRYFVDIAQLYLVKTNLLRPEKFVRLNKQYIERDIVMMNDFHYFQIFVA